MNFADFTLNGIRDYYFMVFFNIFHMNFYPYNFNFSPILQITANFFDFHQAHKNQTITLWFQWFHTSSIKNQSKKLDHPVTGEYYI